ncbi:MAG: ribosome maturation factor RimP, partial [Candidatus Omnitrophica bacterium]|nr:ribosome maturation factor RimP [Candidatus Omnitrophota bacterium]
MLLLRFLADRQGGISIQECAKVNRRIGFILEEADIIDGNYTLEVSSPGADRLLKTRTDFWLNTGQRIRIVLNESVENRKTYVGLLKSVADNTIIIESEAGPDIVIALDNIAKAKQEVRMR